MRTLAMIGLVMVMGPKSGCGSSKEPGSDDRAAAVEMPTRPAKPDVATAKVTIEVTVRQLLEDYAANEVGADAKYRDQVFRVHGLVERVGRDGLDRPVLRFFGGSKGLRADFASDSGLATLKPYDEVFVRCRGEGLFGGAPVLSDCIFDRVVDPGDDADAKK